ncbi:hypothetical protein BHE74_00009912 [Ensete ventricosum]|nr:hypothetical protein GW17_00054438 [Ensete ventricosum]RWW81669.1 hypothetical protein BHE74_00009912 [Ensete ventricosum]RZR89334.1 hypothetical protein BHM03_00017030 [Ensete ventricosum]
MLLQVASISETGIEARLGLPLQEQRLRRGKGRKWQLTTKTMRGRVALMDGEIKRCVLAKSTADKDHGGARRC